MSHDPRPLAEALERVIGALGGPSVKGLTTLFDRWDDLVGERIAAHARPQGLDEGTLVVVVDEPGWATQLRFLEGDLLRRFAQVLGPDVVRTIVVRAEGPGPRRGHEDQRGAAGRLPPS